MCVCYQRNLAICRPAWVVIWLVKWLENPNIKYTVHHTKSCDFDDMFGWLIQELKENGNDTSRTIVYCQSRKVVTEIYESFLAQLPQSHRKYVNMFHSTTPNDVQQFIIDSFSEASGDIRILIATIAYGMGIDVRGVNSAVMSGRIGRDGSPSVSTTIKYPGDSVGRRTTPGMKDFLKGDQCRRRVILEHFGEQASHELLAKHSCCDVCAASCKCQEGGCPEISIFESKLNKAMTTNKQECTEELMLNIPTPKSVDKLCMRLEEYRLSLLSNDPEYLYCGADLSCGFSKDVVEKIIKDCNVKFDFNSFVCRYAFPNQQMALDVWNLVESTLERSFSSTEQQVLLSSDSEVDSGTEEEEETEDEYKKPVMISDSDTD